MRESEGRRWAAMTAVAGTVFIVAGAFWLSFTSIAVLMGTDALDRAARPVTATPASRSRATTPTQSCSAVSAWTRPSLAQSSRAVESFLLRCLRAGAERQWPMGPGIESNWRIN